MNRGLNRFNWIAPYYDSLAKLIFGKSIFKAQTCHLKSIPAHARVLVLGGGSGKWLNELLQTNHTCKIWYVEASSAMLERAKANIANASQVSFIHGTERNLPELQFDVVITHFFLDLFNNLQLDSLIHLVEGNSTVSLLWIVSDFEKSRWWHKMLLKLMFLFFNISGTMENRKLPDWNAILKSHQFTISETKALCGDFIQCRLYTKVDVGSRPIRFS